MSEQRFEAEYDGDQVSLRNVLLTLPGDGPSTIVVAAAARLRRRPGAASSAAATGILLELAQRAGRAPAPSAPSSSPRPAARRPAGPGIRELIDGLADRDSIEAVVVISQPGAAEPAAAVRRRQLQRQDQRARCSSTSPPSGRSRRRPA